MYKFFRNILPKWFYSILEFILWYKRGFLENAPQAVKQNVFSKYSIKDAVWIETGTYLGQTTEYLAKRFQHIHSIEPSPELYESALKKFKKYKNVSLYNDISENIMPKILSQLNGNINLWLDGHYSAGLTFKGKKECPVEDELLALSKNIKNFEKICILIDDYRCFLPHNDIYIDYPSVDYLVDYARKNKYHWSVEQDIFIMWNF